MKKTIILFIILLIISGVVRFWNLSSLLPSLSMDEVTTGYGAYSLLKTGKDEHGKFLPLVFESMGDFKAPLNYYLTSLSIAVFGFNEFAIRTPAVFFGSISAPIIFLILKRLGLKSGGSFIGGLVLALNPNSIFLSRIGFDGIIGLSFLLLGLLFWLVSINKKSFIFMFWSVLAFSLSVWGYHAEKVFTPLVFVFLITIYRKELKFILERPGKMIPVLLILFIFSLPFIYLTILDKGFTGRAANLWVARDPSVSSGSFTSLKYIAGQYLNYFNPQLWFWKELNLTPKGFPDMGIVYAVDLPLFLVGIYALTKIKNRNLKLLTVFWFFVGLLPMALTRGGINPGRTIIWLPSFIFILSIGIEYISKKSKFGLSIYIFALLLNFAFFTILYKSSYSKYFADLWHFGYKEVSQYVCGNWENYDKIIVTDKYGMETPSIKTIPHYYVLTYCNIDPAQYLINKQLYNLEIRQPQWEYDKKLNNALLIGSPWDFPENFDKSKIMKTITFPNDKPAFYFVETENKTE